MNIKKILAISVAPLLIFSAGNLSAQTWDGGANPVFDWTLNTNWSTDVAPVPSATAALIFDGAVGLTNNNDFTANSQFNTLTFAAGAGAFNLGGSAINLGDGTAGTKITNSSVNAQTITTNLALLQTTTINTGATAGSGITLGGNISGTGFGITSSGAGGLTLSGSNSYSGPTTLSTTTTLRAVANVGNTTAGISSALSPNSVLTLAPSATANVPVLELRADDNTAFNTAGITYTTSSSQARTITIDVANAGSGTNKTLTLGGAFSISAANATNATTLNVTGSNGYSLALGALNINGGLVNINSSTNLSIASVTNVPANFVTLAFNGSGNTTITGDLVRTVISRGMSLTQSGSGSLTLLGAATTTAASNLSGYTFNLSAGTLNLNNALAMGPTVATAQRTVNISGGTLDNSSGGDIIIAGNPAIFLSGNFSFGATRALDMGTGIVSLGNAAGARTITTNGTTNALTLGSVTETAAGLNLTKAGTGTLELTGSAFHTGGTTVSDGVLEVNGASVGALSGQTGTFVAVNNTNNTHFTITVGSTANIRAGQAITGTNIAAGTVVREVQSATKLLLTQGTLGAGTFNDLAYSAGGGLGTGAVTVNGGTLLINPTGDINGTTGVTVNGGNFRYDGTTALNRNVNLNGGKFAHNSASNYAGALNFTSGTIGGSNLSGLNLTIGAGQTFAPGNSTGTVTSDITTFATGGTFQFEINNATGTAGSTTSGWDLANLISLDITAGVGEFTIHLVSLNALQTAGPIDNFNDAGNYSWLFVDAGSAITGFNANKFVFSDSFSNPTTGSFSVAQGLGLDADKLYINYTAIPEPSTALLLVAGLATMVFRRRRSA